VIVSKIGIKRVKDWAHEKDISKLINSLAIMVKKIDTL